MILTEYYKHQLSDDHLKRLKDHVGVESNIESKVEVKHDRKCCYCCKSFDKYIGLETHMNVHKRDTLAYNDKYNIDFCNIQRFIYN